MDPMFKCSFFPWLMENFTPSPTMRYIRFWRGKMVFVQLLGVLFVFTRWLNFEIQLRWEVLLMISRASVRLNEKVYVGLAVISQLFGLTKKKWPCYIKTMSLKILNKSNTTLKKSRKRTYWSWNVRKTLPESQKMCRNFYFTGHLSTLVAKNTTKSRHFRSKNNAQILLKQVRNFQKFHSRTFLTPKVVKYVTLKWPKLKKNWIKT